MFNLNIAREMVQARLLSALFSQSIRSNLILKGGMAMRVATGSERYTKDIDLSSPDTLSVERIQSNVRKAIGVVKSANLLNDIRVSEPKQTDSTLRWKIGGVIGETQISLTVEISRRPASYIDHMQSTEWTPPNEYAIPPVVIDSLDLNALALTKMSCLTNPNRQAPRDIYDLNLLILMEIKPPMELLTKIGAEKLNKYRETIWDKLDAMTFEEAKTHLWPQLPEETRDKLDRNTWETMRLNVGQTLDRWIDEATESLAVEEDLSKEAVL